MSTLWVARCPECGIPWGTSITGTPYDFIIVVDNHLRLRADKRETCPGSGTEARSPLFKNEDMPFRYVSPRGHVYVGNPDTPLTRPLVTVEACEKWYALYVFHPPSAEHPLGRTEEIGIPHLDSDTFAFCDHVPNPQSVEAWAERMGYDIEPLALELMYGRWKLEVEDSRP